MSREQQIPTASWSDPSLDAADRELFDGDGGEAPTHIASGTLIAGRFRIGHLLGRGAHGSVYEAEHVVLGYPVAIKVLHAAYGRDPHRRARFRREALLGARLRHRNIASIHDAGELPDGSPFLVMEHVDGSDLSVVIDHGRLDPAATVEVGVQLLAAVTALCERGVIHRDIKPNNVMLQRAVDGYREVKLLDFGISKAMSAELTLKTLTADDCVLGTPQYMSPEQVTGAKLDVRSDLYSVGAVLYECLTGAPPFDAETPGGVLAKILTTVAPKVRALRPDVPQPLADLIDRAVEKRPEDRWGNPAEMSEALRALALRLGLPGGADAWRWFETDADPSGTGAFALVKVRSTSIPPSSSGSAIATPLATESAARPAVDTLPSTSSLQRRKGLLAFAAALPVALVLGGATWMWSGGEHESSANAQPASQPSPVAPATRESDESSARADTIEKPADASELAMPAGTETPAESAPPPSSTASSRPALDPAQLERRARVAFLAGRDSEAVSVFTRATEIAPARASAWRGLGLAAAAAGDHRTGARALLRYLALAPDASDRAAIERRLATLGS